jgi:hypothetical protein
VVQCPSLQLLQRLERVPPPACWPPAARPPWQWPRGSPGCAPPSAHTSCGPRSQLSCMHSERFLGGQHRLNQAAFHFAPAHESPALGQYIVLSRAIEKGGGSEDATWQIIEPFLVPLASSAYDHKMLASILAKSAECNLAKPSCHDYPAWKQFSKQAGPTRVSRPWI